MNLFRHPDNSIHVTFAEADGIKSELGDSKAPLYLCALNALRAAQEIPIQATSEGAFRLGAAAMRDILAEEARTNGNDILAQQIENHPLPAMPARPIADRAAVWEWWSGSNDEYYTNGPFASREAAISALDGYGGFIVEAVKKSVQFSADQLIDSQYFEDDDYFSGEHGEPDRAGGGDAIAAADAELQAVLDAWLAKWGHTFVAPEMFAMTRNRASIAAEAAG
jgi:hypothetical protein